MIALDAGVDLAQGYLSLPDAQLCLTLSVAMRVNGSLHVACLDIAV